MNGMRNEGKERKDERDGSDERGESDERGGTGRGGLQHHCSVFGTENTSMDKGLPGCQLVDTPVF